MKKRVLSMLLAVILCFSTLPMTAFAQDADVVTEQEEQQEADPAEEQEEQQEVDSAEGQEEQQEAVPVTEQKEAEAAAAPGEETPADKSTVAGEAPDTVEPSVESVSDSDAGTQDTGTDDEKKAAVQKVQALIDALPETVTEDNAESVGAQLEAIAEAMDSLTEEQIAELDMKRYETVCAAPIQLAAVQAGEHTHYLCGGDECNGVGHTEDGEVTFQPWYYWDRLPTEAGNYYLMYNVNMTISFGWTPADGTILCLNGKTITVDTPTPEGMQEGIWLYADRTLTLCDCIGGGKFTHAEKSIVNKNTDIAIRALGTFNMYGGNITGNTAGTGAGVVAAGTFNMYGGSITNNMARHDVNDTDSGACNGGGVRVGGGTFNMFAGEITGNKGENGAGVSISRGTFNMEGGIISGNTAASNSATTENTTEFYGGGVYITGGTFNMTGGEITGNTARSGSGVYVAKDGCFTVSGSAKISGNNGSNVYLPDGATITIGEGGLADSARIGVTTEKAPAQNSFVAIATGAVDGGYKADTFIDDQNSGYEIRKTGDMVVFANGKLHEHPICGAGCEHTGDEKHVVQPWRGISSLNEITADGNYYLLNAVTITSVWSCAYDVQLCLNGHTITRRGDGNVIDISSGHSLVITDCQETAGKITNASSSATAAQGVHDEGTFTLWNGIITGNTASGVSMSSNSKFIMNGGAITENTSTYHYGGGVTVSAGGEFIMNGGTISNNKVTTTSTSAGGVYVYGVGGSAASKFIMNGGSITGNTSAASGGGVVVGYNSEFIMNGGSITGNISENAGAGVCVNKGGSFVVSGAAQIRDNRKNGTANNVYLSEDQIITIGSAGLTTGENGAKIGITTEKEPSAGSEVQFAAGASESVDYAGIFTLDVEDKDYSIFRKEGNLYISAHQHSWIYTAGEAVITARCSKCDADGGSITLDYPFYLVYDRNAKNSKIINNGWQGLTVNENDITYKTENGTPLDGAPVNAGTYVANISLKGADNKTATASLEFTISKGLLTVKVDSNLCKVLYGEEFKFPDNAVSYEGFVEGDSVENVLGGKLTYNTNYEPGDNVGDEYLIVLDGLISDNYIIEYEAGSLTVIPRTVSLSWKNTEDRSYGDGKGEITVSVEGLLGTDDVSAVVEDAVLTTGTHTARVTGLTGYQARDYKLPDEERTCTYTVAKAAQTLKYKASEANITYYEGLEYPNTLDTSGCHTAVTYISDKPEVAAVQDNGIVLIVGAGTARITATAAEGDNYNSAEASFTLKVAKCPVIISGIKADDKIYDGNPQTTFRIDSAEIKRGKGMVGEGSPAYGDVEIDITNATATFEDANAGENKIVTFRGFALSGNDADNYELSEQPADTNAAITPATITVTPDAGKEKTYGENDPELTHTCSGAVSNETPSFNGALRRTFGETVGSYAINLGNLELKDNTDGNFRADNYKLELSNGVINFTINKATPVITVIPKTLVKNGVAVDITNWASFNNTDPDAKLTYTLVGAPVGITLEGNKLTAVNADTTAESFEMTVTAGETTNFTAPEEKRFTVKVVEKEDAEVKIDAPTTKTYGDADFTLKATTKAADNGTWSWTSSNEAILEIVSGANTAEPTIHVVKADATGAKLTATYISDAYYGMASVTITVNPKTVTAAMIGEMESREYNGGAIMPTPEVKDGETILTPGGDFEFGYSDNTNAGTATLTITGKGNYKGTADKTFTIERKDIAGAVIALEQSEFSYNGSTQTVKIQSVTVGGKTLASGDYSIVNGSDMFMSAKDSIPLTIEGRGNYTGTATTTWKITKIDPVLDNFVVTPDLSTEQTYDGNPKAVSVQTKDAIGMGAVKVYYEGSTGTDYTKSETAPVNAGTYQVTLEVSEGTNYNAAQLVVGTMKINKAVLTLENIEKKYGFTESGEQTISIAGCVPDATGYTLGTVTGNTEIISGASVDQDGNLKFTLNEGKAGKKLTLPVTISSANYKDTTVNVVIIQEYRIIDGANSSWTQNTDGTVVIRGNGDFSMFYAVKVDGKVIDPANYEAKEGSTIITLKAEYLKTLAAGSHTFEIVWTDGSAGTDFTVVVNTPSNNGNSSNNDSNHGSDNSGNTAGAAANTAAATAQELDKVPATGDPFGIWLTLFAISLTGLAGMLAKRKKN